jgi:peptide-methionine (S)-S-oxide reductase
MIFNFLQFFCVVLLASTLACNTVSSSTKSGTSQNAAVESPVADTLPSDEKGMKTAVFAGGCFWGLEAVFEHIKGVKDVTSGYSGGDAKTADYETVSNGTTGHAESVKITYDPSKVSYEQLLKVFFAVAHDPTELNRQGPDTGTQYRSAIFYNDAEQKKSAENYIAGLTESKAFSSPIVTQVVPLKDYYKAEDYHQNYLEQHPNQPYIVINDQPKVENLKKQFPELYVSKENSTK